ncbi:MAG TPA: cadherin-like domain-containing protein [Verrucomicrobiae bacterium]|nr:cadherin-like domain-containing protein [Verrucomicrobiae bacterium]
MKALTRIVASCAVALLSFGAKAGLNVPYTADANTLHLWHFDDSTANQGTANFVTVTDAVTGGITMTNYGLNSTSGTGGGGGDAGAAPNTPPYTNIFLLPQAATANLSQSLQILPGGGPAAGKAYAMCGTTNDNVAGSGYAPTLFCNPTTGAFTFEALIYIQGNVFSTSIGSEWEIFSGDNQGGGGLARGWQFRVQPGSAPSVDINFINATGGTAPNVQFNLPLSGPDALTVSNWYHVAVTYTGNAPTNSDPQGKLTFYWTFFDPSRTNADLLFTTNNAAFGTLGGTPIPEIGGSARIQNGVGNAGAFQGLIDEVRISAIARASNDMAFISGGPQNPPSFVTQPPASTLVGYGQQLTLSTLPTGTPPLFPQWQTTNTSLGGWTNIPGQTDSTLNISPVTFANGGLYRLVITNSIGSRTSSVASVTVGAAFSELFNTGANSNDLADPTLASTPDLHYTLAQSFDVNNLGPNTLVWDMSSYPLLPAGIFAFVGGQSQWIGPEANTGGATYTSPQGTYIYQTKFLLDSVDLTQPVTMNMTWWANTTGGDVLLNGVSMGIHTLITNLPSTAASFTITNGFVPGVNTIQFITPCVNPNGSYPESAVRIELSGIGQSLAAGKPVISTPPANQTIADANFVPGSVATFSVVALGRPPLSYQWYADSNLVSGATNRTLVFDAPSSTASPGTNFQVVISNDSGSVTSSVAVLTLLSTNQLPIVQNYSLVLYSNTTATFNLDTGFQAATDPDNSPLMLGSPAYDVTSTNGGSISQNGSTLLTYTPQTDYTGADEFNYYISDSQGGTSTGAVSISVLPLVAPTNIQVKLSGKNVVLTGVGPGAGASFHLFSTTNLTVPLSNWTAAGSGTFDNNGNVAITNPVAGAPQQFYIFAVP